MWMRPATELDSMREAVLTAGSGRRLARLPSHAVCVSDCCGWMRHKTQEKDWGGKGDGTRVVAGSKGMSECDSDGGLRSLHGCRQPWMN